MNGAGTDPPASAAMLTATCECSECGSLVADIDGPVHKYVPAIAGCWALFGQVQADELARIGYPPAHRLVVDAYMAQHPGDGSERRARQSVFVHLVALCVALERGESAGRATQAIQRATQAIRRATQAIRRAVSRHADFPVLRRAGDPGLLTIVHMAGALDLADDETRARAWARCVWDSWNEHQPLIRASIDHAK